MLNFLTSRGIRAVAFGLETLLVPSAAALGPSSHSLEDRSLLFRRASLDPKSEPLAPLLLNKPGVSIQAPQLMSPFFRGEPPHLSALFAQYEGREPMAEDLRKLRDAGITLAVWDNCLAGTTQRVHTALDQFYHGLFPRPLRFLSSRHESQLGEDGLLKALWSGLKMVPDSILCVTPNPGQRDYGLRQGIASFLFEPGSPSFLSALEVYLGSDGRVRDPFVYMGDIVRLEASAGDFDSFKAILWGMEQYQNCGALQSDFRCLKVDRKIWSFNGLADNLRNAGAPLPPRFKSEEEILADAHRVVDGYLAQIERGVPALARSAMLGLMSELTSLCRLRNEDVHESWLIRPLAEKVSAHIRERHELYTERAKVFHEDEWATLTAVHGEDDDQLDRRYEEWVEKTQSLMREMSAAGRRLKEIRRMVKERLVDDLILRMMELEMTYRSLLRGLPLPDLFPRHHNAKNRVASLTANIKDKSHWNQSFVMHTKTLQGWVHGLLIGMIRKAKEAGGHVTFTHAMDAGLPAIELADLTEPERKSIDDILTELMANAVKYRRPGVLLDVSLHMTEGDGTIEFRVSDNGVGIEDIAAVLDRGVREHPDMADGYGGGLVSMMRHVRSHDGWSLAVQSQPGEGSTFTLSVSLGDKNSQRRRLTESGFPKG